jgi:hypothetical protein
VQTPNPHKALNLSGRGRGGRISTRRTIYLKINKIPAIKLKPNLCHKTNYKNSSICYICQIVHLQGHKYNMATTSSKTVVRSLMLEEMEELKDIDTPHGSSQKRVTSKAKDIVERSNKKKSKNGEMLYTSILKQVKQKYWLGFSYMETLAIEARVFVCSSDGAMEDLVLLGYMRREAKVLKHAIVSFPRVPQKLYPSSRSDKVLGQHYNLTQLPFEVETSPEIGPSLDFHITIYFEQPKTPFEHDDILTKALERFEQMEIPLGTSILHPATVLCKHTKRKEDLRIWAGIIKVHLLKPKIHAIDLLRGTRQFILQLDNNNTYLGKVAKGYDAAVRNNLLFVKFEGHILQDITAHALFKETLKHNFDRRLEYEITGVQKGIANYTKPSLKD